jgi:hypothetical protein
MKTIRPVGKIFFPLLMLIFFALPASAQDVKRVDVIAPAVAGDPWSLEVSLSPAPDDPTDVSGAYLIKMSDGTKIIPTVVLADRSGIFVYNVTTPLSFPGESYEYFVSVNIGGKKVSKHATVLLKTGKPQNTLQNAKADEEKDADVYVAASLVGANKRKTRYSIDLKAERYFYLGKMSWTPFFKLNASTDPDADPDSLQAGLNFRKTFFPSRGTTPREGEKKATGLGASIFRSFYYDNGVKIESQRDFKNTNLIYETRLTVNFKTFPPAPSKTFFRPRMFFGGEFGKNLKSPLPAAEGDGIARVLAGAAIDFLLLLNEKEESEIAITNEYIRRWPLSKELGFKADDAGVLQLVDFGKGPRDYFKSGISWQFNKFAGIFVNYEWGRVPPSYKLVDHSVKAGFLFKLKRVVK